MVATQGVQHKAGAILGVQHTGSSTTQGVQHTRYRSSRGLELSFND